MEVLYICPVVFIGNSKKIAMEYRFHKRKLDRRTRFYKQNKNYIIKDFTEAEKVLNDKKFNLKLKDNRIILPNGKTAFSFYKTLQNVFEQV